MAQGSSQTRSRTDVHIDVNDNTLNLPQHVEMDIDTSIEALLDGADARETVEALITRHDDELRDAIIGRLRAKIEEKNSEHARERTPLAGRIIAGGVFNPAAAVLFMATGTYESIEEVFRATPGLRESATDCGRQLLDGGVEPDMKMLARLIEIYDRALAAQRASSEGVPDANPSA
jgi:hypothetical protein